MRRTRIKICGVTRLSDAIAAADLGADAIGFVFWAGSPRTIATDVAAAISSALPSFVTRVGVFVDADREKIAGTIRVVGLDAVQLHGDERVEPFADCGARVIKAVTLETDEDLAGAMALGHGVRPLVDARDRVRRGGTGQLADWARARALAERRPVILAGGLSSENVSAAVRTVRPEAVDVSSGVEVSPGVKDLTKMRALFEAVRTADRGAK